MILVNFRLKPEHLTYLQDLAACSNSTLSDVIRKNLPKPRKNIEQIDKNEK